MNNLFYKNCRYLFFDEYLVVGRNNLVLVTANNLVPTTKRAQAYVGIVAYIQVKVLCSIKFNYPLSFCTNKYLKVNCIT